MAYGAQIFNTSGQVLIDSEFPSYVSIEQGNLSNWRGTYNGEYLFDCASATQDPTGFDPDSYPPNPNPLVMNADNADYIQNTKGMLFVRLTGSAWIWFGGQWAGKDGINFSGIYSNVNSLQYAYAQPRSNFPQPNGYGMALFDSDGTCTWDSEYALGYVAAGTDFLGDGQVFNHPSGAEWVAMPNYFGFQYVPGSYSGGDSTLVSMGIRRNSATQIEMFRRSSQRVGNSGGQYAQPIGCPVLVGKF